MSVMSIVFDVVVVLLLVLCAIYYARKGFAAGLLNFVGTLAAILVAGLLANHFSTVIFDVFFRSGLEKNTANVISAGGVQNLNDLLRQVVGFLPVGVTTAIAAKLGTSLDFSATDIAHQVVNGVVAPLVVPIIAIILFFVVFLLLRILISMLAKALKLVNHVPVIGAANRIMGIVFGVLIGLMYAFMALCVLWGIDAVYSGTGGLANYFGDSFVWKWMYPLNFFAQ